MAPFRPVTPIERDIARCQKSDKRRVSCVMGTTAARKYLLADSLARRHMSSDSIDDALSDAKDAAKQLASAATRLSKKLLAKAETAARNPSGSAKKVAHRVAKELDAASREIDRILKDL